MFPPRTRSVSTHNPPTRSAVSVSAVARVQTNPYAVWNCLTIDDIYEMIVEELYAEGNGKGSVASLAATCKTLHPRAVAVLWQELDSIVPLFKLFPSHIFCQVEREDGSSALDLKWFDKKLLDCTRVGYYSQHVKRFHWNYNYDVKTRAAMHFFLALRGQYLFPNVRSVTWIEPRRHIAPLLDPASFVNLQLQELHLSAFKYGATFTCRILDKVREYCRNLKVFHLVAVRDGVLRHSIANSLTHLLESVNLREFQSSFPIPQRSYLALAQMPDLKRVDVVLESDIAADIIRAGLRPTYFPAVEEVSLSLKVPDESSLELLRHIASPYLWKFFLSITDPSPHGTMLTAHLDVLSGLPCGATLQCFDLHVGPTEDPEFAPEAIPLYITLDILSPILRISTLLTFGIRSGQLLLCPDDFRTIARSLPRLQVLMLLPRGSCESEPAPLSALVPFAELCPDLVSVAMAVDCIDIPELPERWNSNSLVENLALQLYPPENCKEALKFLAKIFPRMEDSFRREFGMLVEPEEQGEQEAQEREECSRKERRHSWAPMVERLRDVYWRRTKHRKQRAAEDP